MIKQTAAAIRQGIAAQVRVPGYVNIEAICADYAPYHDLKEFNDGFIDYLDGRHGRSNLRDGVERQAYDRGYEAGMRVRRFASWVDENVGVN